MFVQSDSDGGRALDLLDVIAAELSINERRQAAETLASLSAKDDWSEADRMAAAGEVFRLVTGVPLNAEQRVGGAVDLAGLGVRVFGSGQFTDEEVDTATTIIKESLTGGLTSEKIKSILGW